MHSGFRTFVQFQPTLLIYRFTVLPPPDVHATGCGATLLDFRDDPEPRSFTQFMRVCGALAQI